MGLGKLAASLLGTGGETSRGGEKLVTETHTQAQVGFLRNLVNGDPAPRCLGFVLWLPSPGTGCGLSWHIIVWVGISECVGLDSETASGLIRKVQHLISTACPGNKNGKNSLCATYLNFLVKIITAFPLVPTFLH